MDFLNKIKKVDKMVEFIPTKKLSELEVQHNHPITNLKFVQTKFGKSIVVDVANEFTISLPRSLVKVFDEDEELFKKMVATSHDGQLYMNYYGGKYNSVEFKHL